MNWPKIEMTHKIRTRQVMHEDLEKAAYYHWMERGCPEGDAMTDWLAAEKEGPAMRSWRVHWVRTHRKDETVHPGEGGNA